MFAIALPFEIVVLVLKDDVDHLFLLNKAFTIIYLRSKYKQLEFVAKMPLFMTNRAFPYYSYVEELIIPLRIEMLCPKWLSVMRNMYKLKKLTITNLRPFMDMRMRNKFGNEYLIDLVKVLSTLDLKSLNLSTFEISEDIISLISHIPTIGVRIVGSDISLFQGPGLVVKWFTKIPLMMYLTELQIHYLRNAIQFQNLTQNCPKLHSLKIESYSDVAVNTRDLLNLNKLEINFSTCKLNEIILDIPSVKHCILRLNGLDHLCTKAFKKALSHCQYEIYLAGFFGFTNGKIRNGIYHFKKRATTFIVYEKFNKCIYGLSANNFRQMINSLICKCAGVKLHCLYNQEKSHSCVHCKSNSFN